MGAAIQVARRRPPAASGRRRFGFVRILNDTGFTIHGVRDALLASGRETCGDELPPQWQDEVAALPDLAQGLRIEPAKGLDEALAAVP